MCKYWKFSHYVLSQSPEFCIPVTVPTLEASFRCDKSPVFCVALKNTGYSFYQGPQIRLLLGVLKLKSKLYLFGTTPYMYVSLCSYMYVFLVNYIWTCQVTGDVDFDHTVKVVSRLFSTRKALFFLLIISKYLLLYV